MEQMQYVFTKGNRDASGNRPGIQSAGSGCITGNPVKMMVMLTLFAVFTSFMPGPEDTSKLIATAIQTGNASELSRYFNNMIDLTLPGYDDSYGKEQAGQILKEFFAKYPVKSFKITKQGASSDGSQYSIGTLEAGSKSYRVYFLLKTVNGQSLIYQFQVQENS